MNTLDLSNVKNTETNENTINKLTTDQLEQSDEHLLKSKINLDELEKIDGFSWRIQLALIDLLCRYKKPRNALEIGTWHGRSAVIFSSYINDRKGFFWGIEPEPQRAQITEDNCKKVCPNGTIKIERKLSNDSEILKNKLPWVDIVHIDGEHTYNAVYHDLDIVKPSLFRDAIIILDDFYFDLYPQITQAAYKWLDNNPDYVLLAVGACKGIICNKMCYKKYADIILHSEFITELNKYKLEVGNISITRTSPMMDCPTLGISTNISESHYIGNESGDGKMEFIVSG